MVRTESSFGETAFHPPPSRAVASECPLTVNIPGVTEGPTVPGHEKCPLSSIPFLESIFIDLVKKHPKRHSTH